MGYMDVTHFPLKVKDALAVARGVTEPNFGRGRAILVKNLDPQFPTCLKNMTDNSANMMKIIPIIPQSR